MWIPKETQLNFIAEKNILALTTHISQKLIISLLGDEIILKFLARLKEDKNLQGQFPRRRLLTTQDVFSGEINTDNII